MSKQGLQNTTNALPQGFTGGLIKDLEDSLMKPGVWIHARNAVNNANTGEIGVLGNEPANLYCNKTNMDIIGAIHLFADKWVIYSTDDVQSEIGVFDESECSYYPAVRDTCLGFKRTHLISGVSREKEDCNWQVYWADGLNHDRSINLGDPKTWPHPVNKWKGVAWKQKCQTINDCRICNDTQKLDCDAIRLARLTKSPCIKVKQGLSGGTLRNGTYYAVAAYVIKGLKVTDYFMPSNMQTLFDHLNVAGSLDLEFDLDTNNYDEFELVIVATINQQTVAKKIGIYSTHTKFLSIDQIKEDLPSVPIAHIPVRNPVYAKSDAIYQNGAYLLRVGPYSKFDFNYQPFANQIRAKWVNVRYPEYYYRNGGNNVGYLRDEVYPFFIRWVYDTGDKSSSYHIPGRVPQGNEMDNLVDHVYNGPAKRWEMNNTAFATSISSSVPDGGVVVGEGMMGYWESTESYPDKNPEIWNATHDSQFSGTVNPDFNLCGKKIRHHKFPDNYSTAGTNHFTKIGQDMFVNIMGVKFENIKPPMMRNDAGQIVPVPGVVGYEILRGSREGNKTIVAKGIINNMGEYDIEGGVGNGRKGLYQNFPYNDLRENKFLVKSVIKDPNNLAGNYLTKFSRTHFTFHSPDTQFTHPFLSTKELKLYQTLTGDVEGGYQHPDEHPKHKLVTNLAFILSIIGGVGHAVAQLSGKKNYNLTTPSVNITAVDPPIAAATAIAAAAAAGVVAVSETAMGIWHSMKNTGTFLSMFTGASEADIIGPMGLLNTLLIPQRVTPFVTGGTFDVYKENGLFDNVPFALKVVNAIPLIAFYTSEGADILLRLIKSVSPFRQYALQYVSKGFYNNSQTVNGLPRFAINKTAYIKGDIHDYDANYRINNLFRGKAVALNVPGNTLVPDPVFQATSTNGFDNTRIIAKELNVTDVTKKVISTKTAVHYAGLKIRIRNQYGQLDGIQQVPVSTCVHPKPVTPASTEVLFSGDTYIGRYTEKNTFFFFYDWLYGQPDGFEFDYTLSKMIPHPAYWADLTNFETSEFFSSLMPTLLNSFSGSSNDNDPANNGLLNSLVVPSNEHCLDKVGNSGVLVIKNSYFYLFSSGIRDFFVESEINIDHRDWGDKIEEKHYDKDVFTDIKTMFSAKPEIIKSGNYFKYDQSLSISKTFNNFISWGAVQPRRYNPTVARLCHTYYPERIIYSLPQHQQLAKDNWHVFLANNYKDFKSRITCIKPIGRSGAVIFFENESPIQFTGTESMQLDGGTKITIGDGELFHQPLQNIFNAELPFEYGSCQNRLGVINTPAGLFWISQNQGKIFQMGAGEITAGVKYWMSEYLPYKLLQYFPNFELTDNPVIGIGCQAMYDSTYATLYFTKKDFIPRPNTNLTYIGGNRFRTRTRLIVRLGDPRYFEDVSWTISYDPEIKQWISHHDWHPTLMLPSKTHFMSIKGNTIWKHNVRTDLYCNFYNQAFPFEVEFVNTTGASVSTSRNVEYILENYEYEPNGIDRHHLLDFNFDEAIVSNTEQVSGLLRLNLAAKNNPIQDLQYPIINFNNIDILYSKEEGKYRFNQYWDITDDRGEFNQFARRPIWLTQSNGYIKNLNLANLNYNKAQVERKKMRHYIEWVLLRRRISGSVKMLLKLVINKKLLSFR
jgi:hypothetical protein